MLLTITLNILNKNSLSRFPLLYVSCNKQNFTKEDAKEDLLNYVNTGEKCIFRLHYATKFAGTFIKQELSLKYAFFLKFGIFLSISFIQSNPFT